MLAGRHCHRRLIVTALNLQTRHGRLGRFGSLMIVLGVTFIVGPMLRDEEQIVDFGQAMSMREIFDSKRELLKLTLPGEFVFLFRIRFGLMSVLAKLRARANWYRLERRWVDAAD